MTYWDVRTKNVEDAARQKVSVFPEAPRPAMIYPSTTMES